MFSQITTLPRLALLILIYCIAAFILTWLAIKLLGSKLPKDHGREFAVAGALSQGKIRGAGILMFCVFAVVSAVFSGFSLPSVCYAVLLILSMLTGYLDDAAKISWSELKKGLLDLVICAVMAVLLTVFEPELCVLDFGYSLPCITVSKPLFIILATAFEWLMINAVNCTDGIDGLCGGLSINSLCFIAALAVLLGKGYEVIAEPFIMIAVILAYLVFNTEPSTVLMGDAGSRPLGLFLALCFLRMGNALFAIPVCIVMLLDGLLGLFKVVVIRLTKKKGFMSGIRTPLHDHLRKNKGASNARVRSRFNLIQAAVSIIFLVIWLNLTAA